MAAIFPGTSHWPPVDLVVCSYSPSEFLSNILFWAESKSVGYVKKKNWVLFGLVNGLSLTGTNAPDG